MRYIDVYPNCLGCPVEKYCGTAIASTRLCNSYDRPKDSKSFLSMSLEEEAKARLEMEADY